MEIHENTSLKFYNTFGIDVKAKYFVELYSASDLIQVLQQKNFTKIPKLILGGGSNVLFTKDVDALVIHNCIKGIEVISETKEHVYVKSGGGEVWNDLVMYCVEKNYGGIENLSLIPGSVGAAPMQNIGAYGVELKETFYELEAIDILTAEKKIVEKEECKFGYRESIFKHEAKGKYFITSVTLRLNKNPQLNTNYGAIREELDKMNINQQPTIKNISDAICKIRRSKLPDPAIIGNAGSFFKNPTIAKEKFDELISKYPVMPNYPSQSVGTQLPNYPITYKLPAGWLIEQCGWRGKRIGNTGSHKDQALVLVNYGGATGEEIIALAKQIQQSVKEKFEVDIVAEVNVY